MNWRFINTGFRSGQFNMDYDENLARSLAEGTGNPAIRVYGWQPPAISLGYNQKILDIDLNLCKEKGIDIVRRPTGGRAILHWKELTYSVTMFANEMSVNQVYENISKALVRGLKLMGIEAELEKSQPDFQLLYKNAASVSCFSSSARYEIQYQGKKIVGSAQRRYSTPDGGEIVLQHGSILFGPEHRKLTDFLSQKNIGVVETMKQVLSEKTIDAENILGRKINFEDGAACIKTGFEGEWGINFADEELEETIENRL